MTKNAMTHPPLSQSSSSMMTTAGRRFVTSTSGAVAATVGSGLDFFDKLNRLPAIAPPPAPPAAPLAVGIAAGGAWASGAAGAAGRRSRSSSLLARFCPRMGEWVRASPARESPWSGSRCTPDGDGDGCLPAPGATTPSAFAAATFAATAGAAAGAASVGTDLVSPRRTGWVENDDAGAETDPRGVRCEDRPVAAAAAAAAGCKDEDTGPATDGRDEGRLVAFNDWPAVETSSRFKVSAALVREVDLPGGERTGSENKTENHSPLDTELQEREQRKGHGNDALLVAAKRSMGTSAPSTSQAKTNETYC